MHVLIQHFFKLKHLNLLRVVLELSCGHTLILACFSSKSEHPENILKRVIFHKKKKSFLSFMPIFDIWISMFYPPVCTISLKKKMFVMIKIY